MRNENEPLGTGDKNGRDGKKNTQNSRHGKTPKEIVDEHIKNENDEITEEEFKNVKLNVGLKGDVAHEPLPIPDKKERPKDESKDHNKITPWDVLGE